MNQYFDKFSEIVRNQLLLKLSNDIDAAWGVLDCVDHNFQKIPENIRDELLLKVVDYSEGISDFVSRIVSNNFHKMPENVRNELLARIRQVKNRP